MKKPQGFGIDERRYIPVTEFVAHSNGSIHREERKAQLLKCLYLDVNHPTGNTDDTSRQEVASQIAKYAAPSIWGNPTVTCVGSNAGV
jgi:hypothetical protein